MTRWTDRSPDTLITCQRIDELLHFLPLFEKGEESLQPDWVVGRELEPGVYQFPFAVHPDAVESFFQLASQEWWTDYEYALSPASELINR